jgi:hypothetical protein
MVCTLRGPEGFDGGGASVCPGKAGFGLGSCALKLASEITSRAMVFFTSRLLYLD